MLRVAVKVTLQVLKLLIAKIIGARLVLLLMIRQLLFEFCHFNLMPGTDRKFALKCQRINLTFMLIKDIRCTAGKHRQILFTLC